MRLVQISDIHLLADANAVNHGWLTSQSWRDGLRAALATSPEALLLSGDLADDGAAPTYARLLADLEGFSGPILALPGNHDDPERLRDALATRCELAGCRLGAWDAIVLDSVLPGAQGGKLSTNELSRAQEAVATATRPLLLAVHHPPLAVGHPELDEIGLSNGHELLATLEQAQVPVVVLCGHVHQDFSSRRGEILIMSCPSTCRQFATWTAAADDQLPPGFRLIELHDDGTVQSQIRRFCTEGKLPVRLQH